MGYVTWPRPFQGRFVIRRLGFAMFNPHIRVWNVYDYLQRRNEGNAKCKKKLFWATIWGLKSNAQGSSMARWKARCRLPISDNWTFLASFHDCGTIKRNMSKSAFFSTGVGHFERKFHVDGDVARNASMDRSIEERCSYNFAGGSFHTKKLCSRLLSTEVEIYWKK